MLKCVKNLLEKLRVVKYTKSITYNLELKYFKLSEFDSPDEPGSGSKMNINFLEKLDYARHNAGVVFKINSGYRSKEWNAKIGGRVGSSHIIALLRNICLTAT